MNPSVTGGSPGQNKETEDGTCRKCQPCDVVFYLEKVQGATCAAELVQSFTASPLEGIFVWSAGWGVR